MVFGDVTRKAVTCFIGTRTRCFCGLVQFPLVIKRTCADPAAQLCNGS
jgi:hypothetical protein